MHLLALNVQRSSAINFAIYGNFSAPKSQEIVVAKGNVIELLRPDDTGKVISICSTPVFSVVRSLLAFRLAGANKDYVVIGSDAGKISIVEFDVQANDWKLVHCAIFGKTGCRRIVPGQYLAADPKGRAIMIAGIEKQKFVYILNRDSANRLTISSPLEAHKTESILFSMCGVDVGFDNPVFAMIELDYGEADQDPTGEAFAEAEKKLTFYELDLGLNHVVRKWSEPISRTANILLSVPGGDDGPSGVLICGENWISYKNQGHVEVRAPLPRRHDLPVERGLLIVSGTMHKQKDLFFFMIQSELGDLYKVTLVLDEVDRKQVQDIVVTVFDSIQPANSICVTKTGLLFAASEFANHSLFQFQGIGDDDTAVRASRIMDEELNEELGDDSQSASRVAPTFEPSAKLKNLLLIDDIPSLAPITDVIVDDFTGEDASQIVALCGRGNRSSLRVLRHGVAVSEMAVTDLPGKPNAVWTVRKSQDEEFDHYIVVSLAHQTLVLSIGETVEEVQDSGFLPNTSTLQVVLLEDNALLQVHPAGIRHIRADKRQSDWKSPGRQVEHAAVNSRQVVISLSGGEVIYFNLDATGTLLEMGSQDMGKEVSSLDMGLVPAGRAYAPFVAVGCWDDTVQILSLDPSDLLSQKAAMATPARPVSLCLVHMVKDRGGGASSAGDASSVPALYLNVGLDNGVLVRCAVDPVAGSLSDSRQRFLGPRKVRLFRVNVRGQIGVMALTTRAWLLYNHQGRYFQAPVSYEMLEYASSFASEQCPEGIVAVAGSTLRIVTVDNLGEQFNQSVVPLRYTPRKICRVADTRQVVIIETDHNEYNEAERAALAALAGGTTKVGGGVSALVEGGDGMRVDGDRMSDDGTESHNGHVDGASASVLIEGQGVAGGGDEEEEEEGDETVLPLRGPVPPADGKWASCIRVMEPASGTSLEVLELEKNEAAFSVCTCRFTQHSEEAFIIVGTVKDLQLHPRRFSACFINVYRLLDGRLRLLHQTEVDDVPMCMTEFQGKLLVGVGRTLRIYEQGKRKLLLKCSNKHFPTTVARLQVHGDRIYVGDMADSVLFVKYRKLENLLSIFADDTFPRFVTCLCILDHDTVMGGDKFGNVFVLRLPDGASDDSETAVGARALWDQGLLNGAPIKLTMMTHYYLGEAVTAMVKTTLFPGGPEIVIVSTITGGIFAMVPFTAKDDVTFFQHLEMYMRQENASNICQRDHLSYRSYFQPVKETIDGDLCERFGTMPYSKQKEFATDVDRTPAEIMKKLEDTRNIM